MPVPGAVIVQTVALHLGPFPGGMFVAGAEGEQTDENNKRAGAKEKSHDAPAK